VQSLLGVAFKDGVKFGSNHLDDVSQVFEQCRKVGARLAPFFQEGKQTILGVIEGNVRCEQPHTLARVHVDELPNASPLDGANKDVCAENDHLSRMRPSRGGAVPQTPPLDSAISMVLGNVNQDITACRAARSC
jgi:hypothetical protein